jgi:hypothetical protein
MRRWDKAGRPDLGAWAGGDEAAAPIGGCTGARQDSSRRCAPVVEITPVRYADGSQRPWVDVIDPALLEPLIHRGCRQGDR